MLIDCNTAASFLTQAHFTYNSATGHCTLGKKGKVVPMLK
jgi:hypothetical protein